MSALPASESPPQPEAARLDLEYVLPVRWDARRAPEIEELADYLRWLCTVDDVTVVDGSEAEPFAAHAAAWGRHARHVAPDRPRGPNGKVAGVETGVRMARHEKVVIADDDVRYGREELAALAATLDAGDLVRPQSVFTEAVWHTRWDTARILLNRALGHDYPGTHGVRRSAFLAAGGYDDGAMFENLEMARTLSAAGFTVLDAPWLFVPRLAPSTSQFWSQRVRQAYDDFAQPARLVAELALLPGLALTARHKPRLLLAWALAAIAAAEAGRWRDEGRGAFAPTAALWAPAWLGERAVCVWLAAAARLAGGVRYGDRRVRLAAHSERALRAARRPPLPPITECPEWADGPPARRSGSDGPRTRPSAGTTCGAASSR